MSRDTAPGRTPRRRIGAMVGCPLIALAFAGMLGGRPALAQQPAGPTGIVSGIVYDSIVRHTIAGATVEFVDANDPSARPYTTVSDAAGRYAVGGLPFGRYLAGFFHPALDTLGLESALLPVDVGTATQRVNLATPSARTVIATICPAGATSDSTGLLIGHVRSTDGQAPVGGASVLVEWRETIVDAQGVRERNQQVTGQSAEPGWFAICGLPGDAEIQARAFSAADSSGFVEVRVPSNGLRHVSFFIGGTSLIELPPTDTVPGRVATPETAWRGRARLTGTVTDQTGNPVVDAHATVWGTKLDAATNDRGAFTLERLPGGTHTLDVRAIGYVPMTTTVQLAASRPATVSVVLQKTGQVLPSVTVRGQMVYSRNLVDFDRRRRIGFGQFRTSDEIARRGPNMRLSQLLQDINVMGLRVDLRGGESIVTMQRTATTVTNLSAVRTGCVPSLYVDGRLDRIGSFDFYYSDEIAGIEVYREHSRPFEFIDPFNACGSVAIWTRTVPKKPKQD